MSRGSSVADGPFRASQRSARNRGESMTGARASPASLRLEAPGGLGSLVPLEHVVEAFVQGNRDAERRDLRPQLRQIGLLARSPLGLAPVELDDDVDASQPRDAMDQVDQGDRLTAREVDRVAVGG